ncbi:uncharacterized protein AB675_7374 [Cyphellophora attinorum]|uniref:Uncharacterized protein n=1 Tax=Cyphellophora attinorum TaxID=1664694 RepID=A0A0N1HMY9_9EURO|nr:uncharacterized protein AB675_7374 [Phialophora attinorum]KPI36245.1 hypothetical protein AB675_7374 [Phialophora attinorum]
MRLLMLGILYSQRDGHAQPGDEDKAITGTISPAAASISPRGNAIITEFENSTAHAPYAKARHIAQPTSSQEELDLGGLSAGANVNKLHEQADPQALTEHMVISPSGQYLAARDLSIPFNPSEYTQPLEFFQPLANLEMLELFPADALPTFSDVGSQEAVLDFTDLSFWKQ